VPSHDFADLAAALAERIGDDLDGDLRVLTLLTGVTLGQMNEQYPRIRAAVSKRAAWSCIRWIFPEEFTDEAPDANNIRRLV